MTGGELSAEERVALRTAFGERLMHGSDALFADDIARIIASRVAAVEAERKRILHEGMATAATLQAKVARLTAERDERVERHAWDQARASRNRNRARAEAAEGENRRLSALVEAGLARVRTLRLFADGRMKIYSTPPSDDPFNKGIRHAIGEIYDALGGTESHG